MDRVCKKKLNKVISEVMDVWKELDDFRKRYDGDDETRKTLDLVCDVLDNVVTRIEEVI